MKKIFSIFLILCFTCFNCVFSSETTDRLLGGVIIENVKKSSHELIYYTIHGESNNVEKILINGENPNSSFMGVSAQFFAIYCDYPEILKLLLQYGANPNDICFGETVLAFAIYRNNINSVKMLIDVGVDLNLKSNGNTPINVALYYKNFEIAKLLYDNGAILDKKSLKLIKKYNFSFK